MSKAPEIIEKLVEHFEQDIESLKSATYNETELRADFINPFWKALGWDMTNEKGYAMQYRDVKQEYPLKTGLTTEAPDYCFTIAGKPKFFLETKKPSIDVKHAIHPAYQLRRYGWSGKLPLSILTDFEEMAVYDCRIRPEKNDKPSQARIKLYTYTDYIDLWDEISGIFSREAILKGSFDKFADTTKGKRGTSEVDSEFLREIEIWREKLARNIALRNSKITVRELNFAVQATIDRVIFLRMAEDRGIEEYTQLQALCSRKNIYKYLLEIFYKADDKYNSGLFHFKTEKDRPDYDNLTPKLKIDDKVLSEILSRLYYPESPYEFSFMPTEILGNVYEQFLGKVIHLTKGHQAKIEEKPEVKKAGGVYYTPEYIVEYIVANTVGKLCENKTPKEISDLRILDPACGSGSFLIGAYRFLLDYHIKWYLSEMDKKGKIPLQPEISRSGKKARRQPAIYQGQDGEWYLSTSEKKRILLNNIYGVDIDSQAVEVTKLSLLLKVLENENKASLLQQIALFKERALPDLSDNIKCGNSLIGSDFYESDGQTMLFDEEERYRINAFDWEDEFKEIFKRKNKGFDAVIGNPPYVRIQAMKEWAPLEVEFYKKAYKSASKGNYDIYVVFVEKGLELLNSDGKFGFILPHKFFNAQYGEKLREIISEGKHLSHVVHFGDQQVFKDATTYTCLMFLDKKEAKECEILKVADLVEWRSSKKAISEKVAPKAITVENWSFGNKSEFFEKLSIMPIKLGDIAKIFVGTQTSADNVYVINNCVKIGKYLSGTSKLSSEKIKIEVAATKPFLHGKDIRRYEFPFSDSFLICPYNIYIDSFNLMDLDIIEKNMPLTYDYLIKYKIVLEEREKGRFKNINWYAFGYPKSMTLFQKEKIIVPDYNNKPSFTLDTYGYFFKTGYGIYIINTDLSYQYILGLLNSKLLFNYLKAIGTSLRGGYVRFWTQYLEKLPIRTINFDNSTDRAIHEQMVQLVETMLDLHKRLPNANTPHDKQTLQRQIDATDRQIDKLVYELYGLTEEEIRVVEGNV